MNRDDTLTKDFHFLDHLMASVGPTTPEAPDDDAIRAGDDAARLRMERAAIRCWQDELGYMCIRDSEHGRQRTLRAELRELDGHGPFDRIQLGWAAGSAVLATAVTAGSLADFRSWSAPARAGYATGSVAVAGTAAHAAGRQIERRDRRRIEEELRQSELLVRRAHDQWRVGELMAGLGVSASPLQTTKVR